MKKCKFIFSLFLIVVLSACGGDSITNQGNNGGEASSDKDVNIWYYYSGKQQELFEELIDEYNESQDKYNLKGEYVPFADTKKQLSVGLAGENLPDLVIMDVVDNASFAEQGVLEDLTSRIDEWGRADEFYEGPLESATYNDDYYGVPVGSNALGFFYNKDLLKEAGIDEVPETWDELEEAAHTLSSEDVDGFAVSAVKSEEASFQFYPFLRSSNAEYDSMNSEGAKEALSFLNKLIEDGSMGSDIVNETQDDITRKFASGKVAMMVNGPWNIERLKEENPDLNFGTAQIPKNDEFASVLGGENMAVIKDSNVDGAFDFITWLLDSDRIEEFSAETGVFPPIKEVLEESDFWKEDEHLSAFVPIMEDAEPRGPSPDWPSISEAIQIAIQEVFTDTESVDDALNKAAEKIDDMNDN